MLHGTQLPDALTSNNTICFTGFQLPLYIAHMCMTQRPVFYLIKNVTLLCKISTLSTPVNCLQFKMHNCSLSSETMKVRMPLYYSVGLLLNMISIVVLKVFSWFRVQVLNKNQQNLKARQFIKVVYVLFLSINQ